MMKNLYHFKLVTWRNGVIIAIVAIAVLSGLLLTVSTTPAVAYESKARECVKQYTNTPDQIDCWLIVIAEVFEAEGTSAAFDVFQWLYEEYDTFANTGCHRHAHRIGDMAFYYDYLNHLDVAQIDFPDNATACGYGFYHGLIEHMVQRQPTPAFVAETCAYMGEHLAEVAPQIANTCYHGSGHGSLIVKRDELLAAGTVEDVDALIEAPLLFCDSLTHATERQHEECVQGVFTVLVEWMAEDEYGLTLDRVTPFALCDRLTDPVYRKGCFAEFGQKLDSLSGYDPVQMYTLLEATTADESLRLDTFGTGVSGLIQHDPDDDSFDILSACRKLSDVYQARCIKSIVAGKFEHGPPREEYRYAKVFVPMHH